MRRVLRKAGLKPKPGRVGPRIHDTRHTFVVHRILAWYREGVNVQAKLPYLWTYLGHRDLHSTLVYLTITQELLQQAGERFRKLFLRFVSQKVKRDVAKLDTSDLTAQRVIEFLDDAERTRKVKIATRNCRLAAIKGFFTFLADEDPTWGAHSAAVLRIPIKRGPKRDPCSMDRDETEAILAQPDHTNELGMRDRALLALFYNTGARISEVLAVSAQDLRLESPLPVKLFGKGRKERICPLWPETVELLKTLLAQQKLAPNEPIFRNRYGEPLSASGVRFRLRAYLASATQKAPRLAAKRITPHSFRHTAAVHLLESGVDVAVVSNWLGHASLDSTYIYARANLETKRKALQQLEPKPRGSRAKAWKQKPELMAWLDSL